MHELPDLSKLSVTEKDALIRTLFENVIRLTMLVLALSDRVNELEGRLRKDSVNGCRNPPKYGGVPSIADAGWPQVEIWTSFSVLAPAGTNGAVVNRLNALIAAAMKSPAVAGKLEAQALVPVFDTPAEFAAALKKEREHWSVFIKRNNITPD